MENNKHKAETVELVDLVFDMMEWGTSRKIMQEKILQFLNKRFPAFNREKLQKEYLEYCKNKGTPGYTYGSHAANVFDFLEEKYK